MNKSQGQPVDQQAEVAPLLPDSRFIEFQAGMDKHLGVSIEEYARITSGLADLPLVEEDIYFGAGSQDTIVNWMTALLKPTYDMVVEHAPVGRVQRKEIAEVIRIANKLLWDELVLPNSQSNVYTLNGKRGRSRGEIVEMVEEKLLSLREFAARSAEEDIAQPTTVEEPKNEPQKPEKRPRNRSTSSGNGDLIHQYLTEIGQYPLLTAEEEVELAQIIEKGVAAKELIASGQTGRQLQKAVREGEAAKEKFIQSNLRLVVSVAKRYQAAGLPLLDLIQEGNLGLEHAVDKFDWTKGFKFSTYSTWWIRQAITRGIANTAKIIRIPVHQEELYSKLLKAEEARLKDPTITDEKIAERLEISMDRLDKLRQEIIATNPVSLDEPLTEESNSTLGDMVADKASNVEEDILAAFLTEETIPRLLDCLWEQEREVIILRFGLRDGLPKTMEETGQILGMGRNKVAGLQKKALNVLRHPATRAKIGEI